MKRFVVSVTFLMLFFISGLVIALDTPSLNVQTSGVTLSLSWTAVSGAAGYNLLNAPYPYTGPDSIGTADLGGNTSFSVDLWNGAAFDVAIQAYNSSGTGDYSNVESFRIGSSTEGNFNTSDLSGCFSPDNSGLLSYYCFDGNGNWYWENWNAVSGCTGALESGTYQLQGYTLTICDNTGCDTYTVQPTDSGLLLDGDSYTESDGC